MFTTQFWKDTAERAVKSFAQGMILALGAAASLNAFTASWRDVIGFGLGAAALSVLMSVGSAPFRTKGSPSLVKTDVGGDDGFTRPIEVATVTLGVVLLFAIALALT